MNTLIKVIVALVISIFLASCNFQNGITGNGNVVTQNREANRPFETIKATEGIDVFVAQGAQASIKVEADENVIDFIETKIDNGKLLIESSEVIGRVSSKKVYVTLPNVTNLESTSGASIYSMGTINVKKITLDANSGSDINIELQADEVTANTSSGADIEVYGVTNILKADASSGSDIKADRLKVRMVEARASSGSDIDVNAPDEIAIHKSSGGDVSYKGEPKKVDNIKVD